MTAVQQLVPADAEIDLVDLLEEFGRDGSATPPFSPEVLEFVAVLAATLSRSAEARAFPEIQTLAFWMRRSQLQRQRDEFEALQKSGPTLRVPRGTVFHLPPSNVDTIFVYAWVLSLLAGNRNVVRLSSRQSPQTAFICDLVCRLLASPEYESIRRHNVMITYGHDAALTRAISAIADVRVVWGGDQTIDAIRAVPLPPQARELTFADRSSFSVIDAGCYLELDPAGRRTLAGRFFNDGYWFDQMACSSPRLVLWCGAKAHADAAGAAFFDELHRVAAEKSYVPEPSAVLGKFSYSCRAILGAPVTRYERRGGAVTVLTLEEGAPAPAEHCGGGLFYQSRISALEDVVDLVSRRDQTMTYFGFAFEDVRRLAAALNGRGVDRMVPIGQALTFSRFWDGVDVLEEMMRRVHVQGEAPS